MLLIPLLFSTSISLAGVLKTPSCIEAYVEGSNGNKHNLLELSLRGVSVEPTSPWVQMMRKLPALIGPLPETVKIAVEFDPKLELNRSSAHLASVIPIVRIGTRGGQAEASSINAVLIHEIMHPLVDSLLEFTYDAEGKNRSFTMAKIRYFKSAIERDLFDAARPYSELVADLGSALFTNDLAAMANALRFAPEPPYFSEYDEASRLPPHRSTNIAGPRPRDFNGLANFSQWRDEASFDYRHNVYTMFDPVRGVLGAWLKSERISRSPADRFKIVNALIAASSQHIRLRRENFEKGRSAQTIAELNKSYLRMILAQLRLSGLWRSLR